MYSEEGGFYKSSKQAAESYVKEFKKEFNLNYTIFRYGSLYGPRSNTNNGLHRIIYNALRNDQIIYEGNPESMREYIHVKDAAVASINAMHKKYQNESLLLTGNETIKIEDLLKTIAEILNINKKIKFVKNQNTGHYIKIDSQK